MTPDFLKELAEAKEQRTLVFDLETTGLIQGYQPRPRGDVGISEFALREWGKGAGHHQFTDILRDPLEKYIQGKIEPRTYAEMLEAGGPTGIRWQKGFKSPHNVLYGVHERHVDVTRAAIEGRGDLLAKESDLVKGMTGVLEAGHKIKGWNVEFDMLIMSQAAARSNPAVYQRWIRAVNRARNRGQLELGADLSSSARKFTFLAAQEQFMAAKRGEGGSMMLGQIDPQLRMMVEQGKLSLDEIDKLSWNKMIEPHKGFAGFFERIHKRGRRTTYEGYMRWLEMHSGKYRDDVQTFARGEKFPDIRYVKGWSADIIGRILAPEGIKGSTLETEARKIWSETAGAHAAYSDTVYEEVFDRIFRTRAKTWEGVWDEVAPRLKPYGIENQDQFFQRFRSAVEMKSRGQLREVAFESARHVDHTWEQTLKDKKILSRAGAEASARASRAQPETLRKIYSEAAGEVSGYARNFYRAHPVIAAAGAALAAITIGDAMMGGVEQKPIKGLRDPDDSPYLQIEGIRFGPYTTGSARALTDFGSGRRQDNEVSLAFANLSAYRASLDIRFPDRRGVRFSKLEKAYDTWTSAVGAGKRDMFFRGDYEIKKGRTLGVPGLDPEAWVGVVDLKNYNVKVEDADTVSLQRRGVLGLWRKPVSVRLAGIDAPEVRHETEAYAHGRIVEDQFAGKEAGILLEELIEKQQSLRLVIDPSSRTYGRHLGVLIGDRRNNLNLQLVRSGAAAHLPWRGKKRIVDDYTLARAEAQAAAGGIGMWQSKFWQMHRAMGLIAGERVTHTSLTQMKRISKSEALSKWWGLVQKQHHDAKTPYTEQEMIAMHQIGTAHRAEVMSKLNFKTKAVGPAPGLRQPTSQWHIAGYGIQPNQMAFGNVSAFGSGRPMYNPEQVEQFQILVSRMEAMPRELDMKTAQLHSMIAPESGDAFQRKWHMQGGLLVPEPGDVRDSIDLVRRTKEQQFFFDVMADGRTPGGKMLVTLTGEAKGNVDRAMEVSGRRAASFIDELKTMYPDAGIADEADLRAMSLDHMERAKQVVQDKRVVHAFSPQRAAAETVQRVRVEVPRGDTVEIMDGMSAASRAGSGVEDVPVPKGMSGRSQRAAKLLPYAGHALAGLAVLGMGAYLYNRFTEKAHAAVMAEGPVFRHPNEFIGMRSPNPMITSFQEAQWAAHKQAAEKELARQQRWALLEIAVGSSDLFFGFPSRSGLIEAWDYFYEAKGSSANVRRARRRIHQTLRKEGFSSLEIKTWEKQTKMSKGFVAKIRPDLETKSMWEKVEARWEGTKRLSKKITNTISGKKSRLTKGFARRVVDWMKNLAVKPVASYYGMDANEYQKLLKGDLVVDRTYVSRRGATGPGPTRRVTKVKHPRVTDWADLRKFRRASMWAQKAEAFKYLWKHTVSDVGTWGAKAAGIWDLAWNSSQVEQMAMAHKAGLVDILPEDVRAYKNLYTKVGDRITSYLEKSTFFSTHHPGIAAAGKRVGARISQFGMSTAGRVLSKIPVADIGYGFLRGYQLMDQYENSTKGFAIETAAGVTEGVVGSVMFRPGLWVSAGLYVGGLAAGLFSPSGPGAAIAGVLGFIVGFVGAGIINIAAMLGVGYVAGEAVRGVGKLALGARMKRTIDPAAYMPPEQVYMADGWSGQRTNGMGSFQQFHAMDPSRKDLSAFGGAYNPIKGQDINTRTLQISQNKRRVTAEPMAPRPISQFAPTFGLVNNALWNNRSRSRVRSVAQRKAMRHPVKMVRNRSRMMGYAA